MNKIIKYLGILGVIIIELAACSTNNDPFYAVPIEFQGASDIFTDSIKAGYFINNAYTEQPADCQNSFNWMYGSSHSAMFACAGDEATDVQSNKASPSAPQKISSGNWGPTDMQYYNPSDGAGEIGRWLKWGGYHGNRKANTAIQYLPMLPDYIAPRYRNRLMGEALFLRAIQHFHLFQMWGGIPIVDKAFQATDNIQIPRNTLSETVDFIQSEMLKAAALLPDEPYTSADEIGRISKGTCYAYRARTLLYAASPLYNGTGVDGTNNPLLCYGNSDINRWKLAAEAAQMAIDLGWYELFADYRSPTPNSTNATNSKSSFGTTAIGKGQQNYHQVFNDWGANNNNKEMVFGRIRGTNRDTENDNFPPPFTNAKGGTCPSQDLVDDYEMNDGTFFNWNNPTEKANPYNNRDPRFYASIIYDGAQYNRFAGQSNYTFDMTEGGKNKPANGTTNTATGYYLYKFMDEYNCNPASASGGAYHNWMDMRFAEVLLNYAEAANEFGGPNYTIAGAARPLTPIEAVDSIRARAGMPSVAQSLANRGQSLDQNTLREFIRHERRIELAFENQRYFDVRRWMIVEQLPKYVRGVIITVNGGVKTYDPTVIVENKAFDKKNYFFPIPMTEINRNRQLVQNPGW